MPLIEFAKLASEAKEPPRQPARDGAAAIRIRPEGRLGVSPEAVWLTPHQRLLHGDQFDPTDVSMGSSAADQLESVNDRSPSGCRRSMGPTRRHPHGRSATSGCEAARPHGNRSALPSAHWDGERVLSGRPGAVCAGHEFHLDRAQDRTIGISSHRVVKRGDLRSCLVAQRRSSVPCAAADALPRCTELRPNRLFSSSMVAISAERSRCGGDPGASCAAQKRSSSPCC